MQDRWKGYTTWRLSGIQAPSITSLWMYTRIKTLNFHIWIWKKDLTLLQETDIFLSSLRFLENYYAKGNLSATRGLRVPSLVLDFPDGISYKESPASVEVGSVSGSGRSPGGGNDNPLQYFCPENPMDRGGWQATVCGVAKTLTWFGTQAHVCVCVCVYMNLLNFITS